MSDRREFLKQAGALGVVPLSKIRIAGWAPGVGLREAASSEPQAGAVVVENAEMRLVVSPNGSAQSLIHKPTGQECLATDVSIPMFTLTQDMPYDNELSSMYPAKITHFPADRASRHGDQLVISFALVGYEAVIGLRITDSYIGFRLEELNYTEHSQLRPKPETPVEETVFLQLPVRKRENFGEWLNVVWDKDVAVNLLATDLYARIDAEQRGNYYLLQAGTVGEVRLTGVSAALITTAPPRLLDRIAQLEEDYNLAKGVETRRRKENTFSYYEAKEATPSNIDEHIKFAKQGGFPAISINSYSFVKSAGHFTWRSEYPNKMADLQTVVSKINEAGMIAGFHFFPSKVGEDDPYVTPKPDPRLALFASFTLAESMDATATVIPIADDPAGRVTVGATGGTMVPERRILRIGQELISFERYTTTPPYRFEGCQRGVWRTHPEPHEAGSRVGLLAVDDMPSVIVTQNTTIQEEIAERLKNIYEQAGFKFAYYDGTEDVPKPYWYTLSRVPWLVHKQLEPQPLFAEGGCRTNFSWHFLSRGSPFDVIRPEGIKEGVRVYYAKAARMVANDFSVPDFGWIGYWAPSSETMGNQPDMLEYVTSRAAGWDGPISFFGQLEPLVAHPRTPDNLEVLRRWEEVRKTNWLTQAQKEELKNLEQEHILLINEYGKFELVPYSRIEKIAGSDQPARGFVFERARNVYVVYWHTSGAAALEMALPAQRVRLMKELGKPLAFDTVTNGVRIPLARRLYLECSGLSSDSVVRAFQSAKIVL